MPIKSFRTGQTVHHRAAHIWQVLVPWVTWRMTDKNLRPGLISYGRLAEELGYGPQAGRTLAKPLGAIANFCEREGLPMLNAVVVKQDTGIAGKNIWINSRTAEAEIEAVLQHVWRSYKAPTLRQFRTAWEETQSELGD